MRLVKAARRERVALKYVREEKQDSDKQGDSGGYKQQTSVEENDESQRSRLISPSAGPATNSVASESPSQVFRYAKASFRR